MGLRLSFYVLGWAIIYVIALHLVPLVAALAGVETLVPTERWIISAVTLSFIAGGLLMSFQGSKAPDLRGSMLLIPLIIICFLPLFAGLPWITSGLTRSIGTAYYEALSALTASGLSAYTDVAKIPPTILLWRAMLEWFGGLLFFVYVLVIARTLNVAGFGYSRNYFSHGEGEGLLARLSGSLRKVATLYTGMTIVAILVLALAGLPTLKAVMLGLSAVAGGGLPMAAPGELVPGIAPKIALAFIFLVMSLNVSLHWRLFARQKPSYGRDPEILFFAALVSGFAIILFIVGFSGPAGVGGAGDTAGQSITDRFATALLSSVSAMATSGHGIPTDGLTLFDKTTLQVLAAIGGCALGVTGGVKVLRLYLWTMLARRELRRLAHPHGVITLRLYGRKVGDDDIAAIWVVPIGVFFLSALGALILAAFRIPFDVAARLSFASLMNAGGVFTATNFDYLLAKPIEGATAVVTGALMIVGRLQFMIFIATIAHLFSQRNQT